jgi:hypothetical protein
MEMNFAKKGVANAGLTTGIIGTALGALNTLGAGSLIGVGLPNTHIPTCNEQIPVNRYEAGQSARIAELETEVKLRDANAYTLQHLNEMRNYVDNRFNDVNRVLAEQAVKNEQVAGSFALVGERIACCKNEFMAALNRERDERCCADNSIVTYANATFYPKMVADVTTGTTTTAQALYNPLPKCGCCK